MSHAGMDGEGEEDEKIDDSLMQDKSCNFKVVVRFRAHEPEQDIKGSISVSKDERSVRIRSEENLRKSQTISLRAQLNKSDGNANLMVKNCIFTYDAISQNADQLTFYSTFVKNNITDFLQGLNCSVIAYGSTGSGKTYTILGDEDVELEIMTKKKHNLGIEGNIQQWGLLPRCIDTIFQELQEKKDADYSFKLKCGYIEVYNEELYDLLAKNTSTKKITLQECPKRGVLIQNMIEIDVNDQSDVLKCLRSGLKIRKVSVTQDNQRSSRSHTIFIFNLEQTFSDGSQVFSRLNIVDLAGSEKFQSSNEKTKHQETKNINSSLLTLAKCITNLSKPGLVKRHIPFRESKLTQILKESLGGNSKTTIICTVRFSEKYLSETMRTLRFAREAKKVKTQPLMQMIDNKDEESISVEDVRMLKNEISMLKKDNAVLHSKLAVQASPPQKEKNGNQGIVLKEELMPILQSEDDKNIGKNEAKQGFLVDHRQCHKNIEKIKKKYDLQVEQLSYEIQMLKDQLRYKNQSKSTCSYPEEVTGLQEDMRRIAEKQRDQEREISEQQNRENREFINTLAGKLYEKKNSKIEIEHEELQLLSPNNPSEKQKSMRINLDEDDGSEESSLDLSAEIAQERNYLSSLDEKIQGFEIKNKVLQNEIEQHAQDIAIFNKQKLSNPDFFSSRQSPSHAYQMSFQQSLMSNASPLHFYEQQSYQSDSQVQETEISCIDGSQYDDFDDALSMQETLAAPGTPFNTQAAKQSKSATMRKLQQIVQQKPNNNKTGIQHRQTNLCSNFLHPQSEKQLKLLVDEEDDDPSNNNNSYNKQVQSNNVSFKNDQNSSFLSVYSSNLNNSCLNSGNPKPKSKILSRSLLKSSSLMINDPDTPKNTSIKLIPSYAKPTVSASAKSLEFKQGNALPKQLEIDEQLKIISPSSGNRTPNGSSLGSSKYPKINIVQQIDANKMNVTSRVSLPSRKQGISKTPSSSKSAKSNNLNWSANNGCNTSEHKNSKNISSFNTDLPSLQNGSRDKI